MTKPKYKSLKLSDAQRYALQVLATYRDQRILWVAYDLLRDDWKVAARALLTLTRRELVQMRVVRAHIEYFEHGLPSGEEYRFSREYRLTPAGQRYLKEYEKINHTTYAETNQNF